MNGSMAGGGGPTKKFFLTIKDSLFILETRNTNLVSNRNYGITRQNS